MLSVSTMKNLNYVLGPHLITKWIRVGCYFPAPEQLILPKNVRSYTFGRAGALATRFSTSLPHKSGRRASRSGPHLSKKSARTFIGVANTGVSNVMWANVLIVYMAKRSPTIRGKSPGNVRATYLFQIIAMDHISSLPRSYKRTTELLL